MSRLTLNRLLTAIVFIALFTMAVRYPADSDTWWHMRAGQTMWQSRALLTTDPFSHTQAGAPWINHSWLAQLLWYGLLALGGWPAVSLGLAALVTGAFGLAWRQGEGNRYVRAFAVVLGAIASSLVWAARPQMVSFLLAALTAFLLARFKQGRGKLLPGLPLVVLVWVNMHGGFAIAFILLLCYLLGETFNRLAPAAGAPPPADLRHLLWSTLLSLAVVVVNPYTWRMWLYPFQTVGIGVLRQFIAEWQSPNFHQPILLPFLLMLLLLLAAMARCGRKVDWTDLALVGAWTTLSLFAVRNVAIFALVCTPVLARYGTRALEAQFGVLAVGRPRSLSPALYRLNAALLALVALGAAARIAATLSPAAMARAEAERFPADAVAFLQQTRPPGPMFNSYNIGGYLMYHLWPDYPVFVDGRTDLYDDAFLRDYLRTVNALPGWEERLARYGVRLAVLERDTPLAQTLAGAPGWQTLYADEQVTVFARQSPVSQSPISQLPGNPP